MTSHFCACHIVSFLNFAAPNQDVSIGFNWFKKNWQSDFVEYLTASKAYVADKSVDKFDLIKQGATITKGDLYKWFESMIRTS